MVTVNLNFKSSTKGSGNTGKRDHSDVKHFNNHRTNSSSSPLSLTIGGNGSDITIQSNISTSNNQNRNNTTARKSCNKASEYSLTDAFQDAFNLGKMSAGARSRQNSQSALMNMFAMGNNGYGLNDYSSNFGSDDIDSSDLYSALSLSNFLSNPFNSMNDNYYDPLASLGLGIGGYGNNPFGSYGLSNNLGSIVPMNLASMFNDSLSNFGFGNNTSGDYCDKNSNSLNLDSIALNFSTGNNISTTPAGFTKGADGKTASLEYGNNSIAFNQADQSVITTDKITGKNIKVWGDPHGPDGDFKGTKTYKLPDGTSMTLKTAAAPGVTDKNAPTFVQSATFTKKGLDAVRVNNITMPTSGKGIEAETLDRKEARADKDSAVNLVSYDNDFNKIA